MSKLRALNSKFIAAQWIRFVFIGLFNTAFSYLIYASFLFIGFGYQLANFIALAMGILFSFKTQGHLVFNNPDNRLLGRFILSWAVIYMCVIFLIGRLINFGFDAYTAGAIALPFSVALSYLIQKYFVFRQSATCNSKAGRI